MSCHKSHDNFGNQCWIPRTRNQYLDTRKTQAMHADLKHEPKMEPDILWLGSRISHSIRKWGISHTHTKKDGKQTTKTLPLKTKNGTIKITMTTCHIHLDGGTDKLLWVLVEIPQCQPLRNARSVSTDQASAGPFQWAWLSARSHCAVCVVHTLDTLPLWAHVHWVWGARLGLRFTCGCSSKREQRTGAGDTCLFTGGVPKT